MVKAASPTSPQLAAAARWRHGAPPPKAVAACTLVPMRPSWPGPVKLRHVTPGGTTTAPRVPKWNASWLICCAASMAVAALGCVVSPKSPPISPYWLPLSTWPAWLSSGSCARRAAGRCNRPKRRRWVHARLLLAWPLVPLPGPDRSPSQHRPRFPGTCLGSYPHPHSLLDTSLRGTCDRHRVGGAQSSARCVSNVQPPDVGLGVEANLQFCGAGERG